MITFQCKDTLVVYKDGTCESLGSCIKTRKLTKNGHETRPIVDVNRQTITNIACFNTINDTVLLTYFAKNMDTNEVEFVYFKLDNDNRSPIGDINKFKIDRSEQNAFLVGYTVVDGDLYPSLITLCKITLKIYLNIKNQYKINIYFRV